MSFLEAILTAFEVWLTKVCGVSAVDRVASLELQKIWLTHPDDNRDMHEQGVETGQLVNW